MRCGPRARVVQVHLSRSLGIHAPGGCRSAPYVPRGREGGELSPREYVYNPVGPWSKEISTTSTYIVPFFKGIGDRDCLVSRWSGICRAFCARDAASVWSVVATTSVSRTPCVLFPLLLSSSIALLCGRWVGG